MKLSWSDERTQKFVTNVGLITSNGPFGLNIMATEWTHHISYSPSLIAVSVGPRHATFDNIMETKEFGVSLCAVDHNICSSVSGGSSGKEVDKIKVLKELGIEFYDAEKIKVPLVKGAAMNAECTLFKTVELGDHTLFVGEVVQMTMTDQKPLAYAYGKYWNLGEQIQKPSGEERVRIKEIIEKYRK